MFGIPSSTLRFYEKEGILPKISRMQAVIVLPVPDKIHVIRVRSDEGRRKNVVRVIRQEQMKDQIVGLRNYTWKTFMNRCS
ncbi:hypothetical protein AN935_19790 [Bacillus inaquosorum]|uniref:HTH merR-type domain-containing protein n=1 Tax=Bacillus inaquosorum KCTC 13429 TaxID=1236548 RepID=A0A9W5PEZ2_9BACI|nr:hypothetical protein AN935_19790 [Bacillus inaquosorum]AWM18991.1 hypothetical protein DKG76_20730 [Bacillus inaquosorum]ELS63226.1 hypothetical protein BSI_06170 [Bacillus inaquosorum KCTC 13429]PPA35806.1 hypothetical protein C4E21_13185 [Bacillus subtilis]RFM40626.1 hypothetical protein D0N38_01225 [Bacillus inaquosorum]